MRLKPAQQYATVPLSILTSGLLGKLSLIATKTYVVLLLRSDSNRNQCWPSLKKISSDACMSLSSVQKAITELEEIGLIVKQHRTTAKGDAASNLYTIMVPDETQPEEVEGIPCDDTPSTATRCTGTPSDGNELTPLELTPENKNTPSGSAAADAPSKAAKPDVYQAVLQVYSFAGMAEPPRSEVVPLLKAMKAALASGWDVQRIVNAWCNARKHGNPQIWSLAYTLRNLTQAEAMTARPGCKPPEMSPEERKAANRAAVENAFGGALK